MSRNVIIDYTNHRGERAEREVLPAIGSSPIFTSSEWHPEPQWLFPMWDIEKGAIRTFAMKNIHSWRPESTPPAAVAATTRDLAYEIWAAAQTPPGGSVEEAVDRITALLPVPAAVADERDATGRSPTDYALEFAEYMAKGAEQLIAAISNEDMQQMRIDEEVEADDHERACYEQALDDAREARSESMGHVRSSIYEFRKRRDRAAAIKASEGTTTAAPGGAKQ